MLLHHHDKTADDTTPITAFFDWKRTRALVATTTSTTFKARGPCTTKHTYAAEMANFGNLTLELRFRIYRYMCDDGHTYVGANTEISGLAYAHPIFGGEYLSVLFAQRSYDLVLETDYDRVQAAHGLTAHADIIGDWADEFHIYVCDESTDGADYFQNAALRFIVGPRLVDYSSPSAGSALKGKVQVSFDSMRGSRIELSADGSHHQLAHQLATRHMKWTHHNATVAMKIAAAIDRMIRSHDPGQLPYITVSELVQVIGLLDDVHGIMLSGFGDDLVSCHIDAGAVAEFWTMVEKD